MALNTLSIKGEALDRENSQRPTTNSANLWLKKSQSKNKKTNSDRGEEIVTYHGKKVSSKLSRQENAFGAY